MNHIMIDFETFSLAQNAVLATLGAVEFDPKTGELGREFSQRIDIDTCITAGLHISGKTVYFWMGQSREAQDDLIHGDKVSLNQALSELQEFYETCVFDGQEESGVQLWANGPTADIVWLKNALAAVDRKPFWPHWCERCVRTMVQLGREIGFDPKHNMPFKGTAHSALDDAKHQARYVSAIWQNLFK